MIKADTRQQRRGRAAYPTPPTPPRPTRSLPHRNRLRHHRSPSPPSQTIPGPCV